MLRRAQGGTTHSRPKTPAPRWSRRQGVLSVFAGIAALGFAAAYIGPAGLAIAASPDDAVASTTVYASTVGDAQTLEVEGEPLETHIEFDRGNYTTYETPEPEPEPEPEPAAEAAAVATPMYYSGGGSSSEWLTAAGIAESDWGYVDYIVGRESGWNPNATNSSSGACGLVQAYPCSKVPGSGYNPVDNLVWANGYAVGRYGSWEAAVTFWLNNHWW